MRLEIDGDSRIRPYIDAIFKADKRDLTTCELCGKRIPEGKHQLHHTKYEGATIYDLKIVCCSCNLKQENKLLD